MEETFHRTRSESVASTAQVDSLQDILTRASSSPNQPVFGDKAKSRKWMWSWSCNKSRKCMSSMSHDLGRAPRHASACHRRHVILVVQQVTQVHVIWGLLYSPHFKYFSAWTSFLSIFTQFHFSSFIFFWGETPRQREFDLEVFIDHCNSCSCSSSMALAAIVFI